MSNKTWASLAFGLGIYTVVRYAIIHSSTFNPFDFTVMCVLISYCLYTLAGVLYDTD